MLLDQLVYGNKTCVHMTDERKIRNKREKCWSHTDLKEVGPGKPVRLVCHLLWLVIIKTVLRQLCNLEHVRI